ncbi:MAG: hypothetical protein EPO53_09160 [Variovorax sp.]|nr:MAG: hypothetical protein EPO53_09160 [Variovorax sp.]
MRSDAAWGSCCSRQWPSLSRSRHLRSRPRRPPRPRWMSSPTPRRSRHRSAHCAKRRIPRTRTCVPGALRSARRWGAARRLPSANPSAARPKPLSRASASPSRA